MTPPPNSPSDLPRYVLTLSCPDRTGIVAAVTGFLARHRANLVDASHFNDEHTRTSFVRALFYDVGRDLESLVLNRAVKWYAEHRVFENGSRTVVLK